MTLNPYSVLAAFVTALEAGLGVVVLVLVARALRSRRRALAHGGAASASVPLIAWTGFVLVALSVLSWPLLYLLLQSYVPFWYPRVMCIEGVSRIGSGSTGPSAALPGLLAALQWTKPALVFVSGAFGVLHVVDRRTRTAPLAGRLLATLGVLGALAVADAAVELRYLSVEKREETPNVGCCNVVPVVEQPSQPLPFVAFSSPAAARTGVTVVHFSLAALLALGLWRWGRRAGDSGPGSESEAAGARRSGRARGLAAIVVATAALSVPVGVAFLENVASPAFLRRPEHRCPYCILAEAPESVVGVGLFLLGVLAAGWAAVAAFGARHEETAPSLGRVIRAITLAGLFGAVGSALFAAVGLVVA